MGQVAEDMMDGTCCQFCGVWNDALIAQCEATGTDEVTEWEPPGYPWTCPECEADGHPSYEAHD